MGSIRTNQPSVFMSWACVRTSCSGELALRSYLHLSSWLLNLDFVDQRAHALCRSRGRQQRQMVALTLDRTRESNHALADLEIHVCITELGIVRDPLLQLLLDRIVLRCDLLLLLGGHDLELVLHLAGLARLHRELLGELLGRLARDRSEER